MKLTVRGMNIENKCVSLWERESQLSSHKDVAIQECLRCRLAGYMIEQSRGGMRTDMGWGAS